MLKATLQKILPNFLLKPARLLTNAILAFSNSTLLLSLPLFLYLLLVATDFLVLTSAGRSTENLFFSQLGARTEDVSRDSAEAIKSSIAKYLYLFVLLLSLIHWKSIYKYLRNYSHWAFIFIYLLLGTLVSYEPTKVVTNTILIFISFLVALLIAIPNRERYHIFYGVVLLAMLLLHLASFGVFLSYETDVMGFLESEKRYGGLAGNPNGLGATAMIGIWAATSSLSVKGARALKLLSLISLPLFAVHLLMSGSGTSLVTVFIIIACLLWFRFLAVINHSSRVIVSALGVVFLIMILLAVSISTTPAEFYLSFTESLGKDSSLTGRTELWAIARDAISQKPIFGWGYDTHTSVKSLREYSVRFNHYHNGLLDTLVAGGIFLVLLVSYNLLKFVLIFSERFNKNTQVFPLLLPLIILIVFNISEYSVLRPSNYMWVVYVTSFALLTVQSSKSSYRILSDQTDTISRHRKRKRKKKSLRWA